MNANEIMYGPAADSAATKYGLDTGVFRRLIMSESSFDPFAINPKSVGGQNASGIAQFLPSTANSRGIDPFNPMQALDGAAKYLSELTNKFGLAGGIASYKGFADINSQPAQDVAANVMGDYTGFASTNNADAIPASNLPVVSSAPSKPLWQFSFSDLTDSLKSGALSTVIFVVGFIIVLFSIYEIFSRTGISDTVKSVGSAIKS
jgi:hypothetical protein